MKRLISTILIILTLFVLATPVFAAEVSVSNGTVPDWSIDTSAKKELIIFRLIGCKNDPIPKSALVKDTQGRDCIKLQLCDLETKKTKDVLLVYNNNGYNHGGYLVGLPAGIYEIKKIYGMEAHFACQVNTISDGDYYSAWTVYYGSTDKLCKTANGNYIPCETIAFTKRNFTLTEGNKVVLEPAFGPNDCTIKKLHWVSSDNRIAYVDESNTLIAKGIGRVAITCYHEDGVSQTLTITVHPSQNEEIVTRPTQPEETTKPTVPEETKPSETTKPTEPSETTRPSEPSKPDDTTQPTDPSTSLPKEDDETTPPETTDKPPVNNEETEPDTSSPDDEATVTDPSTTPEDDSKEPSEPKDLSRLKEILGAVVSLLILVVMGLGGWLVYKKYFYDKY